MGTPPSSWWWWSCRRRRCCVAERACVRACVRLRGCRDCETRSKRSRGGERIGKSAIMGLSTTRRVQKEKMFQNMKMNGGFSPTVASKEVVMFKDVTTFHTQLVQTEKIMRTWMKANDDYIKNTEKVLLSKAPEIYVITDSGDLAPKEGWDNEKKLGGEYAKDSLLELIRSYTSDLEKEILTPITQWNLSYNTVKTRMGVLENARLE